MSKDLFLFHGSPTVHDDLVPLSPGGLRSAGFWQDPRLTMTLKAHTQMHIFCRVC